ncbi:MAG: DnaA/Hda family protein [Myxococcota bacterium]|nr:DnaA/Hda family protein [Myxococcota bacterium]
MTFSPEVWDGVVRRLRLELPEFDCEAFIDTLSVETRGDGLRISCPSTFHRDRIRSHYLGTLRDCVAKEMGCSVDLELSIHEPTHAVRVRPAPSRQARVERAAAPPPTPAPRVATRPIQRSLLPAQTFDSFIVGQCNSLAREASLAVVRDEEPLLSQLYLCAAPGLGKTHLARAICSEARANGKRPVYVSAESFTNEFLASLRSRQTALFKRKFRQDCDLLVVEDVAFLEGKQSTQLEFFHTVQHLRDAGRRTVFTGTRLPQSLTALDPSVRSQLADSYVATMGTPDAQVRRDILRATASAGGVRLPDESLDLLVESVRGSLRDLVSALGQLVATASLSKKPIDRALTEEALAMQGADKLGSLPQLEITDVVKLVVNSFKTSQEEMSGKSRRKQVLVPRQLAMYLCRRYTDASLADIGRAFGRDHPSVRNAITKIERAILEKAPLRYQLEALVEQLDRAREPS